MGRKKSDGKKYGSGGTRTKIDFKRKRVYATAERCKKCDCWLGLKGGYKGHGICKPCFTGDPEDVKYFQEDY